MKKFGDPTGNGSITITQTTHGESASNPNDLSKQQAVDIRMSANEYYHSICEGIVEKVTTAGGGYVSVIPTGCNFRVLYVHTSRPLVRVGQKVQIGQRLGQIKQMTASHLHLGFKNISGKAPHPNPMEYISRGIPIKPAGEAIKKAWFDGDRFKWEMFADKGYLNETPSEPTLQELYDISQKQLADVRLALRSAEGIIEDKDKSIKQMIAQNKSLGDSNSEKTQQYAQLKDEFGELQKNYDIVYVERNRFENEKNEAIRKLSECENEQSVIKNFVQWLSKIFGNKNE